MLDLLTKPEEFRESVNRTTASNSTITLFGHRAPDLDSYWGYVSRGSTAQEYQLLMITGRVPVNRRGKRMSRSPFVDYIKTVPGEQGLCPRILSSR